MSEDGDASQQAEAAQEERGWLRASPIERGVRKTLLQ
jgi:hypothetical protein